MSERENQMQKVRMYSFALTDATLFLDGHPQNAEALAYHNKVTQLYDQAVKEYEKNFGPLTMRRANDTMRWTWIDDPWPWEGADN